MSKRSSSGTPKKTDGAKSRGGRVKEGVLKNEPLHVESADELLRDELRLTEELIQKLEGDKLRRWVWNPKQWEMINATERFVMLTGPNQAPGKTTTALGLAAIWASGRYPPGYTGIRFDKPPVILFLSLRFEQLRDVITSRLLGPPHDRGSGFLPRDSFSEKDITARSGGADFIAKMRVKHAGLDGNINGFAELMFLSYASGWRNLQSITADGVLCDEDPGLEVEEEMRGRLIATRGPLRLFESPPPDNPTLFDKYEAGLSGERLIVMDIIDCTHHDQEFIDKTISEWRNSPFAESKLHGRPVRGESLLFPVPDIEIVSEAPVQSSWPQMIGLDIAHGGGYWAAARVAWDDVTEDMHLLGEVKIKNMPLAVVADAIRDLGGDRIPIAWPHDTNRRDADGVRYAHKLRDKYGLRMLREPAHLLLFGGKKSMKTQATVRELADKAMTGRFHCRSSCVEWLKEKRKLHLKKGVVPKEADNHITDAIVKAMMMRRFAEVDMERAWSSRRKALTEGMAYTEFDFYTEVP